MKLVAFGLVLLGCLQSLAAPDFQVIALYEMRMMLTDSRGVLKDWNNNQVSPCYFDNVRCDQDGSVIGITLSSSGLSGILSPSIATLTTLQQLLLDGNNITGGIPQELGNLSNLMTLKLGRNSLNGSIPESFGLLSELQNLDLSENLLIGNIPNSLSNLSSLNNINLAYNSLSGGSSNSTVKVILGSIGGAVILIVSVVLFLLWWQRMRHRPDIYIDVPGQHDHNLEFGQIKRFSWRELQTATNNFSEQNVLGKGGFGKVYKGVLPGPDSKKVAIKRLFEVGSPEGEMAFLREVELISIAVHKNILRLIGFCTTPTERLLIYPFMENLSVASRLRDIELNEPILDWMTRMTIALGAARGLEYLHEHCNPKIIHRDVKAANVLLDGNFEAVIGDFGLAKMMDMGRNTVTTGVRGTMGHIAPEYFKTGRPSVKTDIFGYGVMLLEIVTGERAIFPDFLEGAGEVMLIDQVKLLMQEGRLEEIVDRNIGCGYDFQELVKIIQVALLCTNIDPCQRPAMSEVVHMLEEKIVPEDQWEEWQRAELTRRQQYENKQHHKLFTFSEESLNIYEAVELSGGR
uniref:non-specific serine/threonine protein kinase n=1 Tax=Aegilops tauschii TaxID=37682 RepID=R7W285_AEGTA